MFTLYCSPLGVQYHYVLKNNVHTLINTLLLKSANHFLSLQRVIAVTLKITDHHKANIIIMKKFEILHELPKGETDAK